MPIVVNLDVMMARRHKGAGELSSSSSANIPPQDAEVFIISSSSHSLVTVAADRASTS